VNIVCANLTKAEAVRFERSLICFFGRLDREEDGTLFNLQMPRDKPRSSLKGRKWTEERRELQRRIAKERGFGKWMIGRAPVNKGFKKEDYKPGAYASYTPERRREAAHKTWVKRRLKFDGEQE
jgi:hypothetical protein